MTESCIFIIAKSISAVFSFLTVDVHFSEPSIDALSMLLTLDIAPNFNSMGFLF